jgi:hypothetical protein
VDENRLIEQAPKKIKPGENIPHLVGLDQTLERIREDKCRYQAATFVLSTYPAHWVSKGWIHFPVAPLVKDHELFVPNSVDWRNPIHDKKVLPNLDGLSRMFWPLRDCVYKQLEPQWFEFACPSH